MIDGAASWRTIRYGSPVKGVDGMTLGTVVEVLGSDEEDIFHGLRARLLNVDRDRVIPADRVIDVAPEGVTTDLKADDVEGLTAYSETDTFHLGVVGGVLAHVGWKQDDTSDEEPG